MLSVGDATVTKDTLNGCFVLLRGLLCDVQCYMGTKSGDSLLSQEHIHPLVKHMMLRGKNKSPHQLHTTTLKRDPASGGTSQPHEELIFT